MQTKKLGELPLTSQQPKICVPLVGQTGSALTTAAAQLLTTPAQVAEWRLDYFKEVQDQTAVIATGQRLHAILGTVPLIATFRSKDQGGMTTLTSEAYFKLYEALIAAKLVAAIDIELSQVQASAYQPLLRSAHAADVLVIVSDHHFNATPTVPQMVAILTSMVAVGADVPKLAVMPQQRKDVLALLSASVQASDQLQVPLITMAMGQLGRYSRVLGGLSGSVLTFGQLGEASAPGQLPIGQLKAALDALAGPAGALE